MKNCWIGIFIFLIALTTSAQELDGSRKKFVNHTEFGGLFGRVTYGEARSEVTDQKSSITAQTFNGIKWNNSLAAGITTGMDWYKSALITPIALGLRYQLGKGPQHRFFTLLDTGYGFTWFHKDNTGFESKGGWMLNPGIGMGLGGAKGLTFTVSWKRQHMLVEKPILWNQLDRYEERNYQRLVFRIGMVF
jgi:hypothetical protein